jgi:hypothetical protein
MKASDNEFPSVLFDEQASTPTTPATGFWRAYFKSDGLYAVNDAGTEIGPFGTGGGGGGGAVLQVVSATSTTNEATTSATMSDTSLSAVITPTSGSLLRVEVAVGDARCSRVANSSSDRRGMFRLWDATASAAVPGAESVVFGRQLISASTAAAESTGPVNLLGWKTAPNGDARTFTLQYRTVTATDTETRLRGDNSTALMVITEYAAP